MSATMFEGFTIHPILNDDDPTVVDHYGIHEGNDIHGEYPPLAMFANKQECEMLILEMVRMDKYLTALDDIFTTSTPTRKANQ